MKIKHLIPLLGVLFFANLASAANEEPGFIKRDGEIQAGYFLSATNFRPCGSTETLTLTDEPRRKAPHQCGGDGPPIYKLKIKVLPSGKVEILDAGARKRGEVVEVRIASIKPLLKPDEILVVPEWVLAPAEN